MSCLVRVPAWAGRRVSPSARMLPRISAMVSQYSTSGSLEETVLSTLTNKCKVDSKASLLLCVSGGSDSVAMLHILAKLREERLPHLQLNVLHFNHKLRTESEEEKTFVRELATQYDLPFFCREWEHGVEPTSQMHFEDLQNRAREWRKFESSSILESEQFKSSATQGFVATAHQLDDQVETILLKILRGVHLSRIKGMNYLSGQQIRPLLDVRKADLVKYLQDRKLPWMEDSSNATPKYKRNRVRNELVPLVTELAGGQDALLKRLTELAGQSKQLADWMQQYPVHVNQTTSPPYYFELNEDFHALPEMVRVSALHDWMTSRSPVKPSFEQTGKVFSLANGPVPHGARPRQASLPQKWAVARKGDTLVLFQTNEAKLVKTTTVACGPNDELVVTHPKRVIVHAKRLNSVPEEVGEGVVLYNVPPNSRLQIRKRQDGDIFHPETKANPGKLSVILRDLLLPLHIRDDLLLVCTEKSAEHAQEVLAVYPGHLSTNHAQDTTGHSPLHLQVEQQ